MQNISLHSAQIGTHTTVGYSCQVALTAYCFKPFLCRPAFESSDTILSQIRCKRVVFLSLEKCAGAVGLEAMSRGCQECHFIEMDPAVARDSLARNIAECGLTHQATVHSMVSWQHMLQVYVRT